MPLRCVLVRGHAPNNAVFINSTISLASVSSSSRVLMRLRLVGLPRRWRNSSLSIALYRSFPGPPVWLSLCIVVIRVSWSDVVCKSVRTSHLALLSVQKARSRVPPRLCVGVSVGLSKCRPWELYQLISSWQAGLGVIFERSQRGCRRFKSPAMK